jgi:hypothetical protein
MTSTITPQKVHAEYLAEQLRDAGYNVVDVAVQTSAGMLAVVLKTADGWAFGTLRVAHEGRGFQPPVGAYSDEAGRTARRQATDWFNRRRLLPDLETKLRVDAFGVLLDDDGNPTAVHHVRSAH